MTASGASLLLRWTPESWPQELFKNLEPREALGLLLAGGDRVLGTSGNTGVQGQAQRLVACSPEESEGIWPDRLGTSLAPVGQL